VVGVSISCISKDSLESIGRGCPLLKSLKFKKKCCENIKCDEDAFAIANTMPKLRLLMIFGNSLTNVGLLSILDACPLLEDLDLRECLNLDLSGRLGKRCQDQIIYLRLSNYDVDGTWYDHDNSCQRSQSKMYAHSDVMIWASYAELPNTTRYYDVDDNDNDNDDDYYCPSLCDSLEYDFDYLLYLAENENLDGSSHDYA